MPYTFSTTAYSFIGEMVLWAEAEPLPDDFTEVDSSILGIRVENDFREDNVDAWADFLRGEEPELLMAEL